MRRMLNLAVGAALAAIVAVATPNASMAQSYPTKPVTMIVVTPPGSLVDILARLVGDSLSEAWGQQVVIQNIGGAGGSIGSAKIAEAANDGYTLGFVPANLSTHPHLYDIPYDVLKDFTPISQVAGSSLVMYGAKDLGADSVAGVIELAKSKPGDLTYASAGNGSIAHLSAELFKTMAGVDIEKVSYKKFNLGILDVVAGRVSMVFMSAAQGMPHVRDGKLTALGTTSMIPNPGAPELEPIAELGVPGYEIRSWFGVVAPANIPQEVVDSVYKEIVSMSESPAFNERMAKSGLDPIISTPDEFQETLATEIAKWGDIISATQ